MINNSNNNKTFIDIDDKVAEKPAYKKMLNNLLGISNRDNSVFVSSRTNNIDLFKLLNARDFNKVFNSSSFKVNIGSISSNTVLKDLSKAESASEFIEIIEENALNISISDRILIEDSFSTNKELIISKIKRQKDQKIARWKRFRCKYLDLQAQRNTWPLYVGSMFIKIRTTKAPLYAPLIMKKVELSISGSNMVQVKSIDDSIDINQKLLFLLQHEVQFNLPKIHDEEKYSLNDVIEKFSKALSYTLEEGFDFQKEFKHFTKNEVKNQELQYEPGAILTINSPSGGNLRDKLISLIMEDKTEDILDIDPLRNIKKEINDEIENHKGLYRVTETDLSQEKAIIGSLKDSSIIWGPPGTGKSQTIANIIANLLESNSKVLVTSEKKAALDVIQTRMNKLSKYMFFGLVDKNVNKEQFYKPFRQLVNKMTELETTEKKAPEELITSDEWNMLYQKDNLKGEDVDNLVKIWKIAQSSSFSLDVFIENISILKEEEKLINSLNNKEKIEDALKRLKIQKKGLFKRYPKNIRFIVSLFKSHLINVDLLKSLLKVKNIEHVQKLNEYLNVERKYSLNRYEFKNDEDYLDCLLAKRMKEKIDELKQFPDWKRKVNSFLKNCNSGFRIPYKFVDIHKDVIKWIYNVFVSTPQALSSIINMNSQFDFAIFDEASQLHIEKAIPFLSMAKISIIAGDHQQMRPTSYFGVRDSSELLDDSEENVDSLLDYAKRKGLGTREYMLTKNYRSKVADLMMFSSEQFYNSNLDVIDSKDYIGSKSIEVYDVNGKWEGRANLVEAKAMLNKLLEEMNNFKKIILLTLNSPQKQFVETLIYGEDKYKVIINLLEEERVVLRNLENIQGDEANLVIVSVAYDKSSRLGSTYVARPEGKNALNVAISRAIEKMIVFKSISSNEVATNAKNESIIIFKNWLSYLEASTDERRKRVLRGNKYNESFDSTFEEDVFDELKRKITSKRKIFLKTQFVVGTYSVDLAIIEAESNMFLIGIEVDGYKYHSGFEKRIQDIERQRFIEAKGYKPIYRITELDWKLNKEKVINNVQLLLNK